MSSPHQLCSISNKPSHDISVIYWNRELLMDSACWCCLVTDQMFRILNFPWSALCIPFEHYENPRYISEKIDPFSDKIRKKWRKTLLTIQTNRQMLNRVLPLLSTTLGDTFFLVARTQQPSRLQHIHVSDFYSEITETTDSSRKNTEHLYTSNVSSWNDKPHLPESDENPCHWEKSRKLVPFSFSFDR